MDVLAGITLVAAPLAGGASTPALVAAAGRAGALGFVAGGYKTADAFAAALAAVRAAGVPYGANLFAPNPVPVDPDAFRRYALRLGLDPGAPVEDDDAWGEKVAVLLADPAPVVSFTFGLPPAGDIAALRRAGSAVLQTVTTPDEARAADAAGVDGLVVQAAGAGGHSGTFTPECPIAEVALPELVAAVRAVTPLPIVGTGGVGTAADVAAALHAGAAAVAVGTLLLLAEEAGTSATHRAALEARGRDTVLTRAFTGRPARGLRNAFIDAHEAEAPLGYPALHHLTAPLRREAAAAGDRERVHLWAGTGYRDAAAGPAASVLARLAP